MGRLGSLGRLGKITENGEWGTERTEHHIGVFVFLYKYMYICNIVTKA